MPVPTILHRGHRSVRHAEGARYWREQIKIAYELRDKIGGLNERFDTMNTEERAAAVRGADKRIWAVLKDRPKSMIFLCATCRRRMRKLLKRKKIDSDIKENMLAEMTNVAFLYWTGKKLVQGDGVDLDDQKAVQRALEISNGIAHARRVREYKEGGVMSQTAADHHARRLFLSTLLGHPYDRVVGDEVFVANIRSRWYV